MSDTPTNSTEHQAPEAPAEIVAQGTQAVAEAENNIENNIVRFSTAPTLVVEGSKPTFPNALTISKMLGRRPIFPTRLEVLADIYLPEGRPVEKSKLNIVHVLPGERPVVDDGFKPVEGAPLPGGRPVGKSPVKLLPSSTLPGGRPVEKSPIPGPRPEDLRDHFPRPVLPDAVATADSLMIAPGRPIFRSDLRILETTPLPNGRPIEATGSFLPTGDEPLPYGYRPVYPSLVEPVEGLVVLGNRPVFKGAPLPLPAAENALVLYNRPIVPSNELDSDDQMTYL